MNLRIGEILRDKKLSQVALAERADISPGYLSEIIAGKKDPSLRTLSAIAEGLSVPVRELYAAAGATAPSPQPGFSESDVKPLERDPAEARDYARLLAPGMRHPSLFQALRSTPLFGIFAGDLLLVDLKPDLATGAMVLVNETTADGSAITTIRRLALPFLLTGDPTDAVLRMDTEVHSINAEIASVIRRCHVPVD